MEKFFIECRLFETTDKNIPIVWSIVETSIPGLSLEAQELPELLRRAADAIPLLLELNGEPKP